MVSDLINNKLFYCKNKDTYPPFKNGFYLEEYFLNMYLKNRPKTQRKYIPCLWTNFQIENWFYLKRNEMQHELDTWLNNNPSSNGYFIVIQHDLGPLLNLPSNTIIYGSCYGNIPIPLIYQDINNKLESIQQKKYIDKKILCSFVGNITANNVMPNVRQEIFKKFNNNLNFSLKNSGGWSSEVSKQSQKIFIETTLNSKFAFAPRGFGRSSFRFFEILKLGTIPIYVWNDYDWLPFKDCIDYTKLCINIHVSELDKLENILLSINEEQYNNMLNYYNEIKHLFYIEGVYDKIIEYLT